MLSRSFIPDLTSRAKPLIIEALRGALDRGHGRMPTAATRSPSLPMAKTTGNISGWRTHLLSGLAVMQGGLRMEV